MTEFEIRYTADVLATTAVLQELIKSVAKLQTDKPDEWIHNFKDATTQQVNSTNLSGGNETTDIQIRKMATAIVEAITQNASHKL